MKTNSPIIKDDTHRIKNSLKSLQDLFDRSTKRWEGKRPPIKITHERVGMWMKMRELKKILSKRED